MLESKLVRNAWLPLLIAVVLALGVFGVTRVRSFYRASNTDSTSHVKLDDPKPFKPKVVKYEVFGSGSSANINYLDLSANPERVDDAPLPWTLVLSTTAPAVFPTISAQSDGDTITCRITIDDEVKDENSAHGVHALTSCLVKSA